MTYYFYNNIFNIGELYSSLQKIDKKLWKGINICSIGYIASKKNGDWENIYSVNPLYLIIGEVDGHIECNSLECEKNESKYLVFDSTDENKEVWSMCTLHRMLGWGQKWNWKNKWQSKRWIR